jgi:hypothetical protein
MKAQAARQRQQEERQLSQQYMQVRGMWGQYSGARVGQAECGGVREELHVPQALSRLCCRVIAAVLQLVGDLAGRW